MGVLMVRKQVNRRTSLVMGISLALLLGAAAAFFIFALPQNLLESLTTSTGLARIMVQAEPPISPNDRGLLSALAGVGTAGLGWVLIDWLLFGRAGISALIKPREDDYEDEEDDYFRPSNPLDLVMPDARLDGFAIPPAPMLDPRRPLSARTDIGDPPPPPLGARPDARQDIYNIPLDQLLPPIEQFRPDAPPPEVPAESAGHGDALSRVAAALAPEPMDLPDLTPSLAEPVNTEPVRKTPGPLILPTAAEVAAAAQGMPPAQPPVGAAASFAAPLPEAFSFAASPVVPEPPMPEPGSIFDPAPANPDLPPIFGLPPTTPAPISPAPRVEPSSDIFASFPPDLPDLPLGDPPLPTPESEAPPAWPAMQQPAEPAPPPAYTPSPARSPAVDRAASLERAALGDLLARLESGMKKRRPTTPPPIPLESFLSPEPVEPVRRPLPVYAAAPAQMIDVPPPAAPTYAPPPAPAAVREAAPVIPPPRPVQPVQPADNGLLDQPLHVALDVLRNRVRRSG